MIEFKEVIYYILAGVGIAAVFLFIEGLLKKLIKLLVRRELNKIKASNINLFYNILCNTYNKGECFKNVDDYCCNNN